MTAAQSRIAAQQLRYLFSRRYDHPSPGSDGAACRSQRATLVLLYVTGAVAAESCVQLEPMPDLTALSDDDLRSLIEKLAHEEKELSATDGACMVASRS